MPYAIREDGRGWRSIDSKKCLLKGESYSEAQPTVVKSRADVELMRLAAYADPIHGSDRHFSEASRIRETGGLQSDIDAALERGRSRYQEIKDQNPWP